MRMTGLGVSPGSASARHCCKRGTRDLRFRVLVVVERELDEFDTARARAREQIEQISGLPTTPR